MLAEAFETVADLGFIVSDLGFSLGLGFYDHPL